MSRRLLRGKEFSLPQPVFFDNGGKRWQRTLICVGIIILTIAFIAFWVLKSLSTPLWAAQANDNPDFPRATVYDRQDTIPNIGDGIFTRIDEVRVQNGKILLKDPFSDRIFREATDDERSDIGTHAYVSESFGKIPDHTLVLSFDDGPHPTYTPPILDTLSKNHLQAVFFSIGTNIVHNEAVFQRTIREGHMVGNHTFNHIDFDDHGTLRDREELISTDRAIRAAGDYTTKLFRLPYGNETDNKFGLLLAQQLGYLHVGFDVDTLDWHYDDGGPVPMPTLDGKGHVVLMHDGGGDRRSSLIFLQKFIDTAKSQGYSFSTLQPYVPKEYWPKKEISPSATDRLSWASLWTVAVLPNKLVEWLTWFGIGSLSLMSFINVFLALINHRRHQKAVFSQEDVGLVTVLIAAFNEEVVIAKTVNTLKHTKYPHFEVVVVDDGSSDKTLEILRGLEEEWSCLRVLTKPQGGKAAALNFGIKMAQGCYIVTLDADTVFTPDTVGNLVRHFSDSKVGAVAGHIKVGNRRNILTAWQSLEYISGICVTRMAEGLLGAVMIAPGACSAWLKSAVVRAGGWPTDTLAEDCDLTLAIQGFGYKVAQDNDAVAWTEAPMTVGSLAKQRLRWTFGNIQVYWKRREMMFRPRHGWLGMVVMPYALLSVIVPLVFMPLTYITAVLSIAAGNWKSIALFAAYVAAVHFFISVVAICMVKERPWHLLVVPVYRLIYEPLRTYLLYASLLKIMRGKAFGWYRPARTNSVVWQNA